MKTILQNLYINKLANLNDQFCFYLFNREELNQKLNNFTSSANPLYTTDLFKNNEYSKKIHVTFEKLPEFQQQNETLNFGAYFSFSYEFFSSYIDDVIVLLEKTNRITLTEREQRKVPDERLKIAIGKCGSNLPNQELFETIEYCRLRRNYFTHILERLNNKFQDLVNNKGSNLNNYWSSARMELDFTQQTVDEFTENETIELLKIIRITLVEIDKFIGGILNKTGVAEFIVTDVYASKPTRINTEVIEKRKRKVLALAKKDFDIILTDTEMDNAVKTIGRK
jgi:hypothetical protein